MSIKISWYVPGRILQLSAEAVSAGETMADISQDLAQWLDEGTPPVHLLVQSRLEEAPTRSAGQASRSMDFLRHPHLGWVMYIGRHSPMQAVLVSLVTRITRLRYREVDTLAAALKYLYEQDATLGAAAPAAGVAPE